MNILIADDTKDVVKNFERAIIKLGHVPICCNTLREACNIIDDPNSHVDIAFIDNHFQGEGYGIDKVRDFKLKRPDMDIVVTTKRDVRPDLVADVVKFQVGFFKKQSDDPTLLEAEISQRINIRREKEKSLSRRIVELQRATTGGGEGIRRLLHMVTGSTRRKYPMVESIEMTNMKVIAPKFERFLTIQVGQIVEINQEYELESIDNWKAATSLELGLGLDESIGFFSSKLGFQIKEKLIKECSLEKNIKLKSSYKIGQKLFLTDEDEMLKIRRREYFRGVEHSIYNVYIRCSCSQCSTTDLVMLRVYVPIGIVEVSAAFDKQGFRVQGEDGRDAYYQLKP